MLKYSKILCATALSVLVFACENGDEQTKAPAQGTLVKSTVLGDRESGMYRTYPGKVHASEKVDLSFEIPGRLIELLVREAQEVKKGELIARLDPRDHQIKVDHQKARHHHAKVTYERYKKLLKTDTVARSAYDEKEALYKIAQSDLAAADKTLNDTYLRVPFSGIIANRYVDNYEDVQAKQKVVSLHDIEDIEIIINIPEADVSRAEQIERVKVTDSDFKIVGQASFPAIPGEQFPVRVKEVSTQADPKTQTYKTTLLMSTPTRALILPGMTANVRMKFVSKEAQYYLVPVEAVAVDDHGKYRVWIVDENTMSVKQRDITVGDMEKDSIKVLSGLQSGERIVTAGVNKLTDGMKVRLIKGRIGKE